MKRIYKYALPIMDLASIRMPRGAVILSIHQQFESICLWALVDPMREDDTEERTFRIAGTGHDLTLKVYSGFVGSVFLAGGSLVFHVFEVKP